MHAITEQRPSVEFHTEAAAEIDPVTFEVVRNKLWNINVEHGNTILRASGGPIVVYGHDLNPAILTEDAEFLFYGPYIQFLACLAEGLAGLGRLEEARARVERALAWADDHGERWYQPELLRLKGDLMLRQSKIPRAIEAEDCFRTANEIAQEQGALFWELRIALSLARLRVKQNRQHDARQVLAPVYEKFTEGFGTPDLRSAKEMLRSLV